MNIQATEFNGQCAFALSLGKIRSRRKESCYIIQHGKKYLFSNPLAKFLWRILLGKKKKAESNWTLLAFVTLLILLIDVPFNQAVAGNAWYFGKITQVMTVMSDGSFIVTIDNTDIANSCQFSRVEFRVSDMGLERTKAALAIALSAVASGRKFGVVVDLATTVTTDGYCKASSSSHYGAAIREA